ncbi:hypothetical protein D3C83_219560 [compost metagenome]
MGKAPVGLRSCYQFATDQLSAAKQPGSTVGIARGDEEGANRDNRDEDEDSQCDQQFSREGHTSLPGLR